MAPPRLDDPLLIIATILENKKGEKSEIYLLLTFGFQIATRRIFSTFYTHHFVTSLNVTPKFPVFSYLFMGPGHSQNFGNGLWVESVLSFLVWFVIVLDPADVRTQSIPWACLFANKAGTPRT